MSSRCLALLLALGLALPVAAGAQQAPPAAPKTDPAEVTAAKALVALFNDPTTLPNTFDAAVDNFRLQFPHSTDVLSALVLAVRYHRARSEYLAELRYGVAALALDPNDLYCLSSLGSAIPDNIQDSDLNRDQLLAQAEGYDRQVIGIAGAWIITTSGLDFGGQHYPQKQAETLRNNLEGPAYMSLGHIASLRQQYAAAVTAYQQALPFEPASSSQAEAYYDIGAAQVDGNHPAEAQAALDKARSLAGNSSLLLRMIQVEEEKLNTGGQP